MSSTDKFDAIIIGAGPSGSACAYVLAREGKSVLMIERGTSPGSKNITGGRLYTYALDIVEPGLWKEAAFERIVTHERIMMLDDHHALTMEYSDPSYNESDQRPHAYTILRGTFDEWFASQAEQQGAVLACGVRVDDIVLDNNKIIGVKAGDDILFADIVIAADGVNSLVAHKAGLSEELHAHTIGVGVKEVIELPSTLIEERFQLNLNEGAAIVLLGCTEGIHGGGFLYTNRESISLGCVFSPEDAQKHGRQIHDIFQEFKMHQKIYSMIKGGQTVEYSAHLVKEAGYRGLLKNLYKEGLLIIGEAAGFVINAGYTIRGIDLAIVSGVAAARAILAESNLSDIGHRYIKELNDIKLLATMKAYDNYFDLLEIPRIYKSYPAVISKILKNMFTITGDVPINFKKEFFNNLRLERISKWQLIKDAVRGYRAI